MKLYLFVGLILFGCTTINDDEGNSKELQSLKLIRDAHVSAVNSKDVELLLRDMSEDVIYLAPGLEPIIGKESLRKFIVPIYEVVSPTIEMTPKNVKVYNRIAIEWGIIEGKISQYGIDSTRFFKNKYLFVYEKTENGTWAITKDIYNDIEN